MLEGAGIAYDLYRHRAVFTAADGADLEASMPGLHCRNLFLRDKKGRMALVTAANGTAVDIKAARQKHGVRPVFLRLARTPVPTSGVPPGSVCPYAVVKRSRGMVRMVLDAAIMRAAKIVCHPLINTMSIGVDPADLVRFLTAQGHAPELVDFTALHSEGAF